QDAPRAVPPAGGSASPAGRRRLCELDRRLLALNASPGGAADLLAACLFLDRLPALSRGGAWRLCDGNPGLPIFPRRSRPPA
ncbi:triphosphoribosyl-dephospho-CoA synthase, partial [Pseudomonas aeruginosa]|uniref:triphosphoribosyl-dephospho-CoA synthase n=1 Tax=Pseudomonas aeruginosa TaxID=287 RepID=UPI003C6E954B